MLLLCHSLLLSPPFSRAAAVRRLTSSLFSLSQNAAAAVRTRRRHRCYCWSETAAVLGASYHHRCAAVPWLRGCCDGQESSPSSPIVLPIAAAALLHSKSRRHRHPPKSLIIQRRRLHGVSAALLCLPSLHSQSPSDIPFGEIDFMNWCEGYHRSLSLGFSLDLELNESGNLKLWEDM